MSHESDEKKRLVDPYMEHPKKKRKHFIIGCLLSIGLVILYLPPLAGGMMFIHIDLWWPLILIIIIELSIIIGVLMALFKKKLWYIMKGMVLVFIIIILIGLIALIIMLITAMGINIIYRVLIIIGLSGLIFCILFLFKKMNSMDYSHNLHK